MAADEHPMGCLHQAVGRYRGIGAHATGLAAMDDKHLEDFRRDLRTFFALQRQLLALALFAYFIALGGMLLLIFRLAT